MVSELFRKSLSGFARLLHHNSGLKQQVEGKLVGAVTRQKRRAQEQTTCNKSRPSTAYSQLVILGKRAAPIPAG
jgi:hypothetical protein